jgi:hypothetical protein
LFLDFHQNENTKLKKNLMNPEKMSKGSSLRDTSMKSWWGNFLVGMGQGMEGRTKGLHCQKVTKPVSNCSHPQLLKTGLFSDLLEKLRHVNYSFAV